MSNIATSFSSAINFPSLVDVGFCAVQQIGNLDKCAEDSVLPGAVPLRALDRYRPAKKPHTPFFGEKTMIQ